MMWPLESMMNRQAAARRSSDGTAPRWSARQLGISSPAAGFQFLLFALDGGSQTRKILLGNVVVRAGAQAATADSSLTAPDIMMKGRSRPESLSRLNAWGALKFGVIVGQDHVPALRIVQRVAHLAGCLHAKHGNRISGAAQVPFNKECVVRIVSTRRTRSCFESRCCSEDIRSVPANTSPVAALPRQNL